MSEMSQKLIEKGYLKTDVVIDAFAEISRMEFVSDKYRFAASADMPLAVWYGQTTPAPSVVAFMLELLQPARGHRILSVGYGSGWIITMLAFIVGAEGHITAIDTLADHKASVEKDITKFNFITRDTIVDLHVVTSAQDIDATQRYQRIIVINPELWHLYEYMTLLENDGVMVAPIDNVIYYFNKRENVQDNVEARFDSIKFLPV